MDFYSDQGAFLVKLLHSTPVPDFVKTSQYETEDSVNSLPDAAFALPTSRQFPIHTPADVYMSAAYYHGKGASDQDAAASIQKAAQVFGIEKEVAQVVEQASTYRTQRTKVAAAAVPWSFQTKTAKWQGFGPGHLADAAERLDRNFAAYDFAERTDIAQNLVKVAADLAVEVPVLVEKFAGLAHVDPERMQIELQVRALALHDQRDTRAFLGKIAELQHAAEATPEEAMKLAAFLDEFDRQAGLTHLYGTRLSDPHSAVFNTSRAEHAEKTATVKIGDVTHQLLDLRTCPQDVFEGILGRKVANFTELADLDPAQARALNQVLA